METNGLEGRRTASAGGDLSFSGRHEFESHRLQQHWYRQFVPETAEISVPVDQGVRLGRAHAASGSGCGLTTPGWRCRLGRRGRRGRLRLPLSPVRICQEPSEGAKVVRPAWCTTLSGDPNGTSHDRFKGRYGGHGVPIGPSSVALGMENASVIPGPSFGVAQRRPPWLSMMDRLTDRPIPMPSVLVV